MNPRHSDQLLYKLLYDERHRADHAQYTPQKFASAPDYSESIPSIAGVVTRSHTRHVYLPTRPCTHTSTHTRPLLSLSFRYVHQCADTPMPLHPHASTRTRTCTDKPTPTRLCARAPMHTPTPHMPLVLPPSGMRANTSTLPCPSTRPCTRRQATAPDMSVLLPLLILATPLYASLGTDESYGRYFLDQLLPGSDNHNVTAHIQPPLSLDLSSWLRLAKPTQSIPTTTSPPLRHASPPSASWAQNR